MKLNLTLKLETRFVPKLKNMHYILLQKQEEKFINMAVC